MSSQSWEASLGAVAMMILQFVTGIFSPETNGSSISPDAGAAVAAIAMGKAAGAGAILGGGVALVFGWFRDSIVAQGKVPMRTCPNCGERIPATSKFCTVCGTKGS